jgi:zinc protease
MLPKPPLAEIAGLNTRPSPKRNWRAPKTTSSTHSSSATTRATKFSPSASELEFYGYPADYLETYKAALEKVTLADVNRVAKKYIHPDKLANPGGRQSEIKPSLDEIKPGPNNPREMSNWNLPQRSRSSSRNPSSAGPA